MSYVAGTPTLDRDRDGTRVCHERSRWRNSEREIFRADPRKNMRVHITLVLTLALALIACRNTQDDRRTRKVSTQNASTKELSLTRLDCGMLAVKDFAKSFSRHGELPHAPKQLTDSCYLIHHGDTYMLWDAGLSEDLLGHPLSGPEETVSLERSLVDQLRAIGLAPDQITIIGISHYHADHTGQAKGFTQAKLLIGRGDLEALKRSSSDAFFQMAQRDLASWLDGKGTSEAVDGDRDVFGDGSVIMLAMPGHTPGHHALQVNLKSGPVLLTGDLYHSREARAERLVPPFNTDEQATLASMDQFEALANRLGAKVVIQHEKGDISKLAAFPNSAR